jgi:hypothetical protein
MKPTVKLVVFSIFMHLFCAVSSIAQTQFNALISATNFAGLPAASDRVVFTPTGVLYPSTNQFLIPTPIVGVTDTNGNYTFTNLFAGYVYVLEIDASFTTFYTNCGFPAGLTGTVNAAAYQGLVTQTGIFAWTSTNYFNGVVPTNQLPGLLPQLANTNGSGLTSLNASAISSGTVPTNNEFGLLPALANSNGIGLTNLSGSNFLPQGANTIFGNGTSSTAAPTGSTNGSYVVNTLTGQQLIGGGSGLTSLNGSSVSSGTVADARLSTNVPLYNASGTFGGTQTFGNVMVNGTIKAGIVTNAVIMSSSTYGSNVYPNLNGTIFGTNGNDWIKGSGSTFSQLHPGDQIIISNTTSQFWILTITNANDTASVYPPVGTITTGSNITVNPAPLYTRDTTGKYFGAIGADGSITVQSDSSGNPGKLFFMQSDGLDTMIIQNEQGDALGYGLTVGSIQRGNGGGSTVGSFKIYSQANYETLTVCPDATYGGSVGMRAITNTQATNIPVHVTLSMDPNTLIQGGRNGGFTTYNTNQFAVAASGWTNTNSFNCTLYITSATAATFTLSDGTNSIYTDTGLTFTTAETIGMGPSYKLTVASGSIVGVATASH